MSTVEFMHGPGVLYSGAELPGRGDGVEGIIELRDFGGPIELKSIEISPFLRSSSFRFWSWIISCSRSKILLSLFALSNFQWFIYKFCSNYWDYEGQMGSKRVKLVGSKMKHSLLVRIWSSRRLIWAAWSRSRFSEISSLVSSVSRDDFTSSFSIASRLFSLNYGYPYRQIPKTISKKGQWPRGYSGNFFQTFSIFSEFSWNTLIIFSCDCISLLWDFSVSLSPSNSSKEHIWFSNFFNFFDFISSFSSSSYIAASWSLWRLFLKSLNFCKLFIFSLYTIFKRAQKSDQVQVDRWRSNVEQL